MGAYHANVASPHSTAYTAQQLSDVSAGPVNAVERHQPDRSRHLANASEATPATVSLPFRPLPVAVYCPAKTYDVRMYVYC